MLAQEYFNLAASLQHVSAFHNECLPYPQQSNDDSLSQLVEASAVAFSLLGLPFAPPRIYNHHNAGLWPGSMVQAVNRDSRLDINMYQPSQMVLFLVFRTPFLLCILRAYNYLPRLVKSGRHALYTHFYTSE